MTTPIRDLAIWNDVPVDVFPPGPHVFPADLDALRELAAVLEKDLREEHEVAVELVRRIQAEGLNPDEDPALVRRLSLPGLRDFLSRRRPEFDRLAHGRVVENTLAYGKKRLEQLRASNAPEVIIDHDEAEVARAAEPGWSSSIDPARLLPNVVATAANFDLDGWDPNELSFEADVTDLILLAAQCCTSPSARALDDAPWLDELAWTALTDTGEEPADASPRPSVVRVRGALHSERCERLEFAIVPAEHAAEVGSTALLAVTMPEPAFDE